MLGTLIITTLLTTMPGFVGETTDAQAPARERLRVTFVQPVLVHHTWLLGTYIIEHDKGRMERGEPCTHLYSVDKPGVVAVAFHCTHLERPPAQNPTVVLGRLGYSIDGYVLREFQFEGSSDGHGVPRR